MEGHFGRFSPPSRTDWYRRNDSSPVYCLFAALGVETRAEEPSNVGQVDLVIEYQGRVWLLEFKVDESDGGQRALEQIKAKGYHHRYAGRPVALIGMDFSEERRNLAGFASQPLSYANLFQ